MTADSRRVMHVFQLGPRSRTFVALLALIFALSPALLMARAPEDAPEKGAEQDTPATAGDLKPGWLGRMAEAMRTQAYEGTLVYAYGMEMESLAFTHGMVDGREHERLRALTGEPFEVIRRGDTVRFVWPESQRVLVAHHPRSLVPSGLPPGLETLPPSYRAEVEDITRIAGRIARVIRIHGADPFRYGYRLWIDRETDLLLRSDLIAPDGEIVERLMFTDFHVLDSIDPALFKPAYEGMRTVEYGGVGGPKPAPSTGGEPRWRVTDLPPGFEAVSHRGQTLPPGGERVQHSMFSDGLASVSVFIDPMDSDAADGSAAGDRFHGAAGMGAMSVFVTRRNGLKITAIGEVPATTARRIARSVEPVENAGNEAATADRSP